MSDTWSLAKIVRKVEFKLLQVSGGTGRPAPPPSPFVSRYQARSLTIDP